MSGEEGRRLRPAEFGEAFGWDGASIQDYCPDQLAPYELEVRSADTKLSPEKLRSEPTGEQSDG